MTIKVTVKNDDPRETAVISVAECAVHGGMNPKIRSVDLKGGESTEVWVHSGQRIDIREVSQ